MNQIIKTPFLIKECSYCQKEFTPQDYQKKNYRLLNQADIPASEPGIFLIATHKNCWTEYCQAVKEFWVAVKNDPIYRWSMGEWKKEETMPKKNQVGDFSLKKLEKKIQESEARQKILTTWFQEISDVELVGELKKRVEYKPTIKLSMYPNHQHIYLEAKDIKGGISTPLPIEIKNYAKK